jgi:hypothetical protein
MAYAAYRESMGVSRAPLPSARACLPVVLDVTVPSCDALTVRRALVSCPEAGILRCIPLLDDKRVRLEILLPAALADEVMNRIMVCVPDGEFGHLSSWRCPLLRHGLTHGF